MLFDPAVIPPELANKAQWVVWRHTQDPDGKWRKPPFCVYTGEMCDITDPLNFATLADALACVEHFNETDNAYSGVGFCLLRNQGISCLDIDNKEGNQTLTPFHHSILNGFNSWTEESPSGTGYHVWVIGEVPNKKRSDVGVELYSCDRFLTVTGRVVNHIPMQERQEYLLKLREEMGPDVEENGYVPDVPDTGPEGDNAICDRLFNMRNGEKFADLYTGNWEKYYQSQSEADLSLTNLLAFANPNREQVFRIFLKSALGKREKAKSVYHFNRMFRKSLDKMRPPTDMEPYKAKIAEMLQREKEDKSASIALNDGSIQRHDNEAGVAAGMVLPADAHIWPVGLLGEAAEFIYKASPRPVYEVSLAAAIGMMAGICGRGVNVSRTGLNMYVLLLAKSGRGKEAMKSGIDKLMSSVTAINPAAKMFIGPQTISSPQALNKHFERKSKSFVSVLGEFGQRMHQMNPKTGNSAQMGVRQMLLDVYNKSGATDELGSMIYSDSDKNVETVRSPAFSILAESNPHTFYEVLDESSVNDGLLPRFLLIEYNGPAKYVREGFNKELVPQSLQGKLLDLTTEMARRIDLNAVFDVILDDQARAYMDSFSIYCTDQINSNHAQSDVVANLWNRAHLKALKLAALLATGVNWHNTVMTVQHAEWAVGMVIKDTTMLLAKFERGEVGESPYAKQMGELKRCVRHYLRSGYGNLRAYGITQLMHDNHIIPYGYLSRYLSTKASFKIGTIQTPDLIRKLVDHAVRAGHLIECGPADKIRYNLKGSVAYLIDDIEFFEMSA